MKKKKKRKPLIDKDGEVRPLHKGDKVKFTPLRDDFPELAEYSRKRLGRPKSLTPKQPVKLRIDFDILAAYKATGKGWQTRMNQALRDSLDELR